MLKAKLVEQTRQIAHLEDQLAAAENDGSLFDLKKDSAENIVGTIVTNISPHKAKEIANGILAAIKTKPKPAG